MKKLLLLASLFMGCSSTEPEDCSGVAGGTAEIDACGICDNHPSNNCQDCSTYFNFNQSTLQAPYYIQEVTIDGVIISAEDYVAAFKEDICVGSQKWDTSLCGGGVCEVMVMGDNGDDLTEGYMLTGNIPTFKIYDVSDSLIYTVAIDNTFPWSYLGTFIIPTLEADINSAVPCKGE